ncbi:cupin domain-containing protein [Sutterella sp.]|uniref:(R)-mandelonitrile lyase n=1 Tax=Sutterella sp. TaxID=1981025 RepID=UPI0026DFDDEF|nr:cupin domain-containing protein [Sutterella sp.]MDO5532537.1 cupin domain-containing protein [Sutterella sp.]
MKHATKLAAAAVGIAALMGSAVAAGPGHTVTHPGDTPSRTGGHETFTGAVRHDSIARRDDLNPFTVSVVTFEPGARTFWHTHPAGQRLVILTGEGLIGTPDGKVERVHPGDIVWCPPGLKHWHGATPTTAMSHMAITAFKDGKNVTWMEEVSAEQYVYPETKKE